MSNNTVVKTFKILDLISKSKTHLTATEISKELDLPTSTTHDILMTLVEEDVIYYKDFKSKTYAIGVKMYALSKPYIRDSNIINASQEYLKDICNKYNLSGYVLKPNDRCMMVTYKYESENSIVKIPSVGYEFQRELYTELDIYFEKNFYLEFVSGISVPIFDYSEKAIGEIKILGLNFVMEELKEKLSEELLEGSKIISKKIGSENIF